MSLDIDISEKKSREIIQILRNYPQGHLEIKFERVFWSSDYTEPEVTRWNPGESPDNRGFPPRKRSAGDVARTMSDTLGSMMGPAPQRRY